MRNKASNRLENKKNKVKERVSQRENFRKSIRNLDGKRISVKYPDSLLNGVSYHKKYNKKQKCVEYHSHNSFQLTRPMVCRRLDKISSRLNDGNITRKNLIGMEILRRQRAEETRVYGENSCRILFQRRPESIVRAWFVRDIVFRFKEIMHWLTKNHKAYHIVNAIELSRIASTKHHGGICFLIKKRNGISVNQWINRENIDDCIIALENIGNPHNIGAIIRSCAHFSIRGVLLQDVSLLETGSAIRIAEGGAEYIQPITEKNMVEACKHLRKAGYVIVTTSSHKGISLFETKLPRKMVLVLGQECNGLSDEMLSLSDLKISIHGTGNVESLNVSVATGILLSEWWRQSKG